MRPRSFIQVVPVFCRYDCPAPPDGGDGGGGGGGENIGCNVAQ
jgi:hypothetical protein